MALSKRVGPHTRVRASPLSFLRRPRMFCSFIWKTVLQTLHVQKSCQMCTPGLS